MSFALYGLVVWLFAVGVIGMVTSRHALHLMGCLSVVQSSTYALLLAIGYRDGGRPAIVPKGRSELVGAVDPIVQAMTVTDIVVGVTASALLVALAVKAHEHFGTMDPRRLAAGADDG